MESGGVVCLQETHGHFGDLGILRTTFPQALCFGTYCSNSAAGGVSILLGRRIARHLKATRALEIVDGRVLLVSGELQDGSKFTVVTVHIVPEWTIAKKLETLQSVREECDKVGGFCILAGDFNFLASGDLRHDVWTGEVSRDSSRLGERFE